MRASDNGEVRTDSPFLAGSARLRRASIAPEQASARTAKLSTDGACAPKLGQAGGAGRLADRTAHRTPTWEQHVAIIPRGYDSHDQSLNRQAPTEVASDEPQLRERTRSCASETLSAVLAILG